MDDGPYRGYHGAGEFDTVKMDAPIRGAAPSPVTSAFDRPPVRAPAQASYMTSNFDEPPVRMHASSPPVTGEFDMPPVRTPSPAGGTGQFSATAPLAKPTPAAFQTADNGKPNASSGSWRGLSQAWLLTDVILRALTLLILVIAVALLPGFLSKLDDYNIDLNYLYSITFPTSSPKYEVALAAIGILYSACGIVFSCIRYFTGKLILGTYSHLVLYIGDQIFVCLYLTAGSVGASHLVTIRCTDTKTCGNGSGAAAMLFFAFALSFGNLILSSISFYKRKV